MTEASRPKVFCTGLSRTGTTALCSALESLGLRTAHWPIHLFAQSEVLALPPFRPALRLGPYAAWRRGKELKAYKNLRDARRILETHDAFGDLPVPLYYRELDAMFPGSLFIHTTRGLEGWLKSMEWLFEDGGILWQRGHIADELHQWVYGTTRFHRELLVESFQRHEEKVRRFLAAKESRGMVIDIDSGELTFERISAFLGLATEKTGPVPRSNETRKVDAAARRQLAISKALLPFRLVFRRLFGPFAL
jgi:hypothetical protein